jgi:hypothetical protein
MESQTQVLGDVEGTTRPCWIIDARKPFTGSTQSYLLPDGTVAYRDGMSFADYNREAGGGLKLITGAELDRLNADYTASLITEPVEIDEERFMYALEILPPCRWTRPRGVELFHVSERLSFNLVDWYACLNGRYWHFVDRDNRPGDELAAKVANAAA